MKQERFSNEGAAIEKGKNVKVILKFIRHGERAKTGELTDYGREITRQRARERGIRKEDFDAVKAVGSQAGPKVLVPIEGGFTSEKAEQKMGRSLESAHIYGHEIAGDDAFKSRPRNILSYETLKSPIPDDYARIYNFNLPDNFESLSNEEKAIASKRAQTAVVNHFLNLKTPRGEAYNREIAGAFAIFILHSQDLAKNLKSGSKVLIPSGTHGGMIEPFLQQALVRRMEDGREIHGFEGVEEIGGDFNPSEAFSVEIKTDTSGNVELPMVSWDDPDRPKTTKMYLDPAKLQELAEFYRELHKENKNQ